MSPEQTQPMVPVRLVRVVLRERSDQQWIFLEEEDPGEGGARGFPIVIGTSEASEIHRIVASESTARPMTHQLTTNAIEALGSEVIGVDVVDLRANTFYAMLRLRVPAGDSGGLEAGAGDEVLIDARPSDALALALRSGAPIRVAESVLEQVRTDQAKDALPPDAALETFEIDEVLDPTDFGLPEPKEYLLDQSELEEDDDEEDDDSSEES